MTDKKAYEVLVWMIYKIMLSSDDNPYLTPPNAEEQRQAITIAKDALFEKINKEE